MQFSLRKKLAIQLLPERFYLKSAEDASHLWSQANDQSYSSFKDMSIPAQHGSDLREIFAMEFPFIFANFPIYMFGGYSPFFTLLLSSFYGFQFHSEDFSYPIIPFHFKSATPNKLFTHISYHLLSIESSGHSKQVSNLVTL